MKIDLGQISIYFWIQHTFLVTSEKFGQTFLSTISQSLKDGSLEAYEVTKPMIILEQNKASLLANLIEMFWRVFLEDEIESFYEKHNCNPGKN